MTLDGLYRSKLNTAKSEYKDRVLSPLEKFKEIEDMPTDLVQLLGYKKNIQKKYDDLMSVQVQPMAFDITSTINTHIGELEKLTLNEKDCIREECERKKQEATEQYQTKLSELRIHNDNLINPFRDKHAELISYKSSISRTCERYNISPLDMNISDTITVSEFGELIDQSLEICEKYSTKETGLFDKAIAPLKGESNTEFVISYICLGLIIGYFLLPVLSAVVFTYMIYMVHNLYKDLEKLKVAVALMSQIDYNRFVSNAVLEKPEPPNLELIDMEMSVRISKIKDNSAEIAEVRSRINEDIGKVTKECAEVTTEVMNDYTLTKVSYKSRLEKVDETIAKLMRDYKPFPTVCSNSLVMSHEYTLGRLEDRLDVKCGLPQSNVVFNSTNPNALNLVKLYLCNALLSVRVKQLTVDIYDPQNQGREFAEFFSSTTQDYIRPNSKPLDKLIEEFRVYAQENIKRLNHNDIDSYNKEAEEKEMVPLTYRLLIMVSEFDKWKKDKDESGRVFKEFFKYSAENGVMIWLLDSSKWSGSVWVDGNYTLDSGCALNYDLALGGNCMTTYENTLSLIKDKGIGYTKSFAEKYIPRDKWWTWDTVKGIELNFGLENGDPSKGLPIILDDGRVHCLCAGATGSGKSALISSLQASLITKYSPAELEIIYIDFKNSEANKLVKDGICRVPHMRIISGTTDGAYALSIFEYLIHELTERQKICAKYGEVNLKDLRKRHPEVVIPRLLVLFDEFQVMFNPEYVSDAIQSLIIAKITAFTKLARAYGGHLLFCSQSMKGTLPKDVMDNFSVRAALRCTKDVSEAVLGNPASGTITADFGYMYTNTMAGEDAKFNKFWRVPFIDVPEVLSMTDDLCAMCEERGFKHWKAEFYDEKILIPATAMDKWYTNFPDSFKDPSAFILGERAEYSTNRAPVTTTLMDDTKENVLIGAFERSDVINLTLTVLKNLQHKEDISLLMHVADPDSYKLIGVEEYLEEKFLSISKPEQNVIEFIGAIAEMVDYRVEIGGPYKPVYIVCVGWENAAGIGVEQNIRATDNFKVLLNKAPAVGVHFVFAMKSKPIEPCSFIPVACNHRITGLMPNDCQFFTDAMQAEKLPAADAEKGVFALYKYGTTLTKFRIYQHEFKATIKSRAIVL